MPYESTRGIGPADSVLPVAKPLSLLLKLSPLVDELSLYDVVNTPGVAADLAHISSPAVSVVPLKKTRNVYNVYNAYSG